MRGHHVAINARVMKSVMQAGNQQPNPDQDTHIQQKICAEHRAILIRRLSLVLMEKRQHHQ